MIKDARIEKLISKFNLKLGDLQAALIIKSLEQAYAFKEGFLAVRQAEIFVNSIDKNYLEDFLG